jgi:hypothetical protein
MATNNRNRSSSSLIPVKKVLTAEVRYRFQELFVT